MENYKKSAVAILVNPKEQILLHLRDNKPGILSPGRWAFIGGSVEEGESELDAIRREVKEEIGCSIDDFRYLDKYYSKRYNLEIFVYVGRLNVPEEKIKVSEGQRVKFFYPNEIKNIKMSLVLKKMISKNLDEILDKVND